MSEYVLINGISQAPPSRRSRDRNRRRSTTARWADWFYRYWGISDSEADYLAAMAPLDPLRWLPEADGRPVLLQFASNDQHVPERVADQMTDAVGITAARRTYTADHHLNDEARAERDAWLAEKLGFPAPE